MKILIVYYSKTGKTEKLSQELQKRFKQKGHSVDSEKVLPKEEKGFLSWFFLYFLNSKTDIFPPKIKDLSNYDLICLGSPNWIKVAPAISSYVNNIKGIKNKKIAIFGTTFSWPLLEWYLLPLYFFDSSFYKLAEDKGGRVADSLFLSGRFKSQSIESSYGEKKIKQFCDNVELPAESFKEYFLNRRNVESARLSFSIFLYFILISVVLQIIFALIGKEIIPWTQYYFLLAISVLSSLVIITSLSAKKFLSLINYFSVFSLISLLTLSALLLNPYSGRSIIIEYIVLFTLFSFFRNPKIIIFAGVLSLLGYGYLAMFYSSVGTFYPTLEISFMLISIIMAGFVTRNLQNSHIRTLESQDDTEMAKASLEEKVKARTKELSLMSEKLEAQVEKRTKELSAKIAELERFNKLAIGRELKMIELKNKIKTLEMNTKNKNAKEKDKKNS